MVHLFFARAVRKPYLVDEWCSLPNLPKFTKVFKNLFPPGGWYSSNVVSYLDAISEGFKYNKKFKIPWEFRNAVENLFEALGFEVDENVHVYQFWCCLVNIYRSHMSRTYFRDDNIFGFMDAFSLYDTKVVIVGKDPSIKFASSGYAFHGSECPSTQTLLDLLNQEMRRVEKVVSGGIGGGVALPNRNLEEAREKCTLFSWINQNVLLVNSWLSYDEELWAPFTNFLVSTLSQELDNVVFILMGKTAMNKVPLIDLYKHCVVRVHHPSHIHRRIQENRGINYATCYLEWDRAMPFVNANFYWYQVSLEEGGGNNNVHEGMVDWSNFAGERGRGGKQPLRWNNVHYRQYVRLFDLAIQAKEEKEEETGSDDDDAYVYLPNSDQVALVVRRCKNGKLILRKAYGWDY